MISLVITVDAGEAIADLERLAVRLTQMDILALMLGEVVSQQMDFNFIAQPWPPLAAATLAKKSAQSYPLEALVRTGQMKGQAVSGLWEATRLGGSEAIAVLPVPGYSTFHWEGTRHMPARDYAFLPDRFRSAVAGVFQEFLSDY